jgi:predicted nucleotidyltransferase
MMEETGMKAQVIEEIRALAGEYGVEKVILFGSRARGNYKRASDIDLAVSGGDILRFALAVDEETSTPLRFDIINLDGMVCEELQKAIWTEGKILYEKI